MIKFCVIFSQILRIETQNTKQIPDFKVLWIQIDFIEDLSLVNLRPLLYPFHCNVTDHGPFWTSIYINVNLNFRHPVYLFYVNKYGYWISRSSKHQLWLYFLDIYTTYIYFRGCRYWHSVIYFKDIGTL